MPPNLDDNSFIRASPNIQLLISALPATPFGLLSDDDENDALSDTDSDKEDFIADISSNVVPLEHNLRALLERVTGTEELERVTQVKLRVIARDVPLQHLSLHIPSLRELILDGSAISSFRDLGFGLKNLKILKVNRCGLEQLDGMLGLEELEELHCADNFIENCMPCAFLSNVKVIDLKRNRLKNLARTLPFLSICLKLEHVHLEGNDEIWQFPKYRQTVKSLLPTVKSLDGIRYTEAESDEELPPPNQDQQPQAHSLQQLAKSQQRAETIGSFGKSRPRASPQTEFTITFPPTVVSDRTANSIR